ncbi:choice-of-anchor tandem repeat GloVer-containing protein [Pseudochryseolinea flava]|uniref:Secretion system C-terminal sorting domain-containing protein n=1 Tax=Pseudochryseolinea flava TaxID=2059302 RepID=A0A364Y272_9BACT|nr:choice-of-anchor tandem repeat GloVer-containing protein [Pseudochryseolinea flava]RAW00187.1 hypothetical protein DQQ10_16710 [Pseudochryseolinea flava]
MKKTTPSSFFVLQKNVRRLILLCCMAMLLFVNTTIAQTLWTALSSGGTHDLGTIGHYDEFTKQWTVDHHFTTPYPGAYLDAGELTEANGKFYGMTPHGGKNGMGALFEWNPVTNAYTTLYQFGDANGANGLNSTTALTFFNGKLFGTTSAGGVGNGGVIFEFDLVTKTMIKKAELNFYTGRNPFGSMQLFNGNFYSTTSSGGAQNRGAIFQWDPLSNVVTKKIDLTTTNGYEAKGAMTLYNGIFYGLTTRGGENNTGVIFSWDPVSNVYTRLSSFPAGVTESTRQLTLSNGKFYGTYRQGSLGTGTVFEWDPSTSTFSKTITPACIDGVCIPVHDVAVWNGKVYGYLFTDQGGIFEWAPETNTFQLKLNFNNKGISSPAGKLAFKDGKFYGVTTFGGDGSAGVIFEWNPATNVYRKKINFNAAPNGNRPLGPLTLAEDKLYGMTNEGGSANKGVLFEFDPVTKVYTKLYDFTTAQGASPRGTLVYYNGKLYGVTEYGGAKHDGVIFSYDIKTHTYAKTDFDCGTTGCQSFSTPVLVEGKFYGTTYRGGSRNGGTIFIFDPQTATIQKRVDLTTGSGASGSSPMTYVDGKFYGVAHQGGTNGQGAIFEWNPTTNIYVRKYDFVHATGGQPSGAMTFFNGKFYGTASGHVLYSWNHITNTYTIEMRFDHNLTGTGASTTLTPYNGKLYGTAFAGGSYLGGTMFWYDPALRSVGASVNFNDASGKRPEMTQILVIPKTPNVYVTSPNDGALDRKIKLNVVSKFAPGVSKYTIELSPSNDFSIDVKTNSGGQTLAFDSLAYNTTYYARVKTDISPFYGKTTTFTTVSPSYYAFVKGPFNHKVDVPLDQTIVLNTVLRATEYTVELNTDENFAPATAMTLTGIGTVYHFPPFEPGTTYYSRVKTNLENAWGETRMFTTIGSPGARINISADYREESVEKMEALAYPNPFRDNVTVYVQTPTQENVQLQIIDALGRPVHQATIQSNIANEIKDIDGSGLYVLKISTASHRQIIKLVKE